MNFPNKKNRDLIVGIDASRNRSGGAIAHLLGILNGFEKETGIKHVHVWAYKDLLERVPEKEWLSKHHHDYLDKSLAHQLWWQTFMLKNQAHSLRCDIIFATDASTTCNFNPLVVLSQDLLCYEPGVMQTYRWGKARLRLEIIKRIQDNAFRRAKGVLFLTEYARSLIQSSYDLIPNSAIVPHGIDDSFRRRDLIGFTANWKCPSEIRCIYVSNADFYKHPWNVVRAIKRLRNRGLPVKLTLIGGGHGAPQELLEETISACEGESWVKQLAFLPHSQLHLHLAESDIFVFASSCENLPVTLLEGMAFGLPIACSNRGPMPEVLGDAGEYFDPLVPTSIEDALLRLIQSPERRFLLAKSAQKRSESYTWERCSQQTFRFIANTYNRRNQ